MSGKLSRHAYKQLVDEDLKWLLTMPRTLERMHIEHILRDSVRVYYDRLTPEERGDGR